MKFSWKILNYIINLESIKFEIFIEQLTLAGFEVEEINIDNQIKDIIIELSITSNRKEICSIINLAREIESILDIPININLKPIKQINTKNNFINKSKQLKYIKLYTINNLLNQESPQWLQNHLIACNIKPLFLIYDIQQYIKIKWGHEVLISDLKKININNFNYQFINIKYNTNLIQTEQIIYNKQELFTLNELNNKFLFTKETNKIILIFFINNININHILNLEETFIHAHNETLRLITTYCGGTINKSYENYKNIKNFTKVLKIPKNEIKNILGPLINQKNKYLSHKNIKITLNKLKLQPQYLYKYKLFKVQIPEYRKHDLKRNIDIIEEIGKSYGFNYFFDKLPHFKYKGNISIKSYYIKKIKNTLIDMGFDEIINSSLISSVKNNKKYNDSNIQIYNPITEEHKNLRINITKNLLENYTLFTQQKKNNIEFFEIGNIFYKNKYNKYTENIHLGGIIHNLQFFRKNWYTSSKKLGWFHAKGILELFLCKLHANIIWSIQKKSINNLLLDNSKNYLDNKEVIYVYNKNNYEFIGFLGKIHKKYNKINDPAYLFEININNLIKSIYFNKHMNYNFKPYSLYQNVTRDISIEIHKNNNIHNVINLILQKNKNLIEYIEIINEYYNKANNKKSICLRIIYKSYYKTLNNKDLNYINTNIQKLLNQILE